MLPYERIQDNPERTWTRPLLDRLVELGVGQDELDDIANCLEEIDDYRAIDPLLDLLTNSNNPAMVRQVAGRILANLSPTKSTAFLRDWWQTGDQVLQRVVLHMATEAEADLAVLILENPQHPLYIDAIQALSFGFERPGYQTYKIKALQHPDPDIREAAASCLVWDEPLAAEDALLMASEDPIDAVVEAACDTLQYYPTQRVFRRLNELEGYTTRYVRDDLIWGLHDPDCRAHLRGWLEPIWDELHVTAEELTPLEKGEPLPPKARTRLLSASEIGTFLDDIDASPNAIGEFFREVDWLAIPEPDRDRLAYRFTTHPDRVIREDSTTALEKWQDVDGLVRLFHDAHLGVRKSAIYHLGLIRPSRTVAPMLWEHLKEPDVWSTHASETLTSYVAHAEHSEALQNLTGIAEDRNQTESLRYSAIHLLEKLEAQEIIEHLLYLIQEPPSVTWALHIILLDAARSFHLKPPLLTQYLAVDHAHIQTAIAPFVD